MTDTGRVAKLKRVSKPRFTSFVDHHHRSTMVLADLGRRLNAALSSLNRAPVVDEKVSRKI